MVLIYSKSYIDNVYMHNSDNYPNLLIFKTW